MKALTLKGGNLMKTSSYRHLSKYVLLLSPLVLGSFLASHPVWAAEEGEEIPTSSQTSPDLQAGETASKLTTSPSEAASKLLETSEAGVSSPDGGEPAQASSSDQETRSSIETARKGSLGQDYSVTGKVISKVNAWGGNGFYLEDQTGTGIYVYPKKDLGVKEGDSVQVEGSLDQYQGELQLGKIKSLSLLDKGIKVPTTKEVSLDQLEDKLQSTLITIKQVTVTALSGDKNGTSNLTVSDEAGKQLTIRVDSRSGVHYDQLAQIIAPHDKIQVTGILSTFKGQIQLKPFSLEHFKVLEKATIKEESPSEDYLTIGQIQGASHRSPYENQTVQVKNVVVTYVASDSQFYVQDLDPDGNPKTSDGINVFAKKHSVMVGDKLIIKGKVLEFQGAGYEGKEKTDLTITQLAASHITKDGMATPPSPLILGKDRIAPSKVVDDDALASFDPDSDGLDFWESLEGMLVTVKEGKILGPQLHREVYVVPVNYAGTFNKVGGITLEKDNVHPDKIAILFDKALVVKTGDSFLGDVTGPISYSYSNYKLLAKVADAPKIKDGGVKPEITSLVKDPQKLTIASYNIENFSANPSSTSDAKVERIAKSFVEDLKGPDIVVLIEVQDNNGADNDGTVDASKSAQRLIDAIKKQGGPNYLYTDIPPVNNEDGGQPGANIRTGFLYNADRVKLSDKPKGDSHTAATWEKGELKYSVARIDPDNPAWTSVRKAVIAEFIFQDQKMNVLALHLKSKRGDEGVFGKNQPPQRHSEPQRHEMASLINRFIQDGMKQNPNLNVAMLGDYNDFEFSKTLEVISGNIMSNLVARHELSDRFSYFYQGNNQSLDNIVLSNNLLNRYEFDMVHVNSLFMKEHGRASDHDPLLVQIDLRPKETEEKESDKEPVQVPNHEQTKVPEKKSQIAPRDRHFTKEEGAQKVLPQTGDKESSTLWMAISLFLSSLFLTRKKEK